MMIKKEDLSALPVSARQVLSITSKPDGKLRHSVDLATQYQSAVTTPLSIVDILSKECSAVNR